MDLPCVNEWLRDVPRRQANPLHPGTSAARAPLGCKSAFSPLAEHVPTLSRPSQALRRQGFKAYFTGVQ